MAKAVETCCHSHSFRSESLLDGECPLYVFHGERQLTTLSEDQAKIVQLVSLAQPPWSQLSAEVKSLPSVRFRRIKIAATECDGAEAVQCVR